MNTHLHLHMKSAHDGIHIHYTHSHTLHTQTYQMCIVPIVRLVALLNTKMTGEVINVKMLIQLVLVEKQFVAILRIGRAEE